MLKKSRRNNRKRISYISDKSIKILLISVLALLLLFIFVVLFTNLSNWFKYNKQVKEYSESLNNSEEIANISPNNNTENISEQTDTTFTLTAIGDVMCHNTQYFDAYNSSTGEYDFSYVFEDVSYYIRNSNIAIANLETTFAGEEIGYSNYPRFNTPDALAYDLKELGIDVLSTAGNHSLDYGFNGLSRTIDVLNSADISHLGTYKTAEDQEKILFKYVKGIKIAFINYSYGTNGIPVPEGKDFCINLIDEDAIKEDVEKAKSQNADIIIACMHWGTEYNTSPNDTQKDLADFLFKNGVNIILGGHPHVLQNMEKRTVTLEDGTTQDGFIVYSLGNFICDQNAKNTRSSIILDLTITKHTNNSVTIDNIDYIPIYMYKNNSSSGKKMKLLDINKTISLYEQGIDTSIGESMYTFLKNELTNISNILNQ